MREVLNISLPPAMLKDIKRAAKKGHFASMSEFIRFLIRDWQERKLANELKKGDEEFKRGEYIKINSLKDIMN